MPWVNPAKGRITSGYGPRWGAFHTGTDIAPGAGVHLAGAANSGVVRAIRTGSFPGDRRSGALPGRTGNGVVIDHGGGIWTYYGHLASVMVSRGQSVTWGQPVGRIGTTGNSTGVHLHFEVLINGGTVNPQPWMAARGAALGYGRTAASGSAPNVPDPRPPVLQMKDTPIPFTIRFTTPIIR